MIFNIPYKYKQSYRPSKRHRKPRYREIEGQLAIEVKEVTDDEFPVAIIVHEYQWLVVGAKTSQECHDGPSDFKICQEQLRTYAGDLYVPVRVSYGTAISTVFEGVTYLQKTLERCAVNAHGYDTYSKEPFVEGVSIPLEDTQNEMVSVIVDAASNFVIYDGVIWQKAGEPMYVIHTFGLGHNHGGTALSIEYRYKPNIPARCYFNALDRNAAVAYGKAVALRRGDTDYVDRIENCPEKIEVLMPEMVKRNPLIDHGDGNEFLNSLEAMVECSDSTMEAGLLAMAMSVRK